MRKKILLVEDEYDLRELYRMILESHNYDLILAVDGEEGFKLALEKPDLILLDVMIPKMNGIVLLKRLKKDDRTKNIPVVLFTNLGDQSIIKAASEMGAAGYLLKARVEPEDLVKQIDKFLVDES